MIAYVACPGDDCFGVAHWSKHLVTERYTDTLIESDFIECPTCRHGYRIVDSSTPPSVEALEALLTH